MTSGDRTSRMGCRGFTLVEAVMSMLVVSLMIGAAMSVSASTVRGRTADAERATAIALVDALVEEVRGKAYSEPAGGVEKIGLDADENLDDRTTCDDVDDYEGLVEASIATEDGEKVPGLPGWSRRVRVSWVMLGDPMKESVIASGIKRIEVTALHHDRVAATRSTLRSQAE